ncbi:hypothetical protein SNOG_07130 [Parastagonospora nodorum SN15]|uniref:Uncharacterized protein n=1 Tax=Phaeosphaeria nodorum (strain SN15 / ATCC MYA-4574 / FGSC 10173) TaxID=321614 RepID=Q0UM84_PHANO|nr:hypothetical protein SNOG_07130 [Parastagonospora nodorum SN15]EAT85781.1 hypothetical protein SNOG_07130 [Parastagonospora nodorum SN15]
MAPIMIQTSWGLHCQNVVADRQRGSPYMKTGRVGQRESIYRGILYAHKAAVTADVGRSQKAAFVRWLPRETGALNTWRYSKRPSRIWGTGVSSGEWHGGVLSVDAPG